MAAVVNIGFFYRGLIVYRAGEIASAYRGKDLVMTTHAQSTKEIKSSIDAHFGCAQW
jgi:hypothetical protein